MLTALLLVTVMAAQPVSADVPADERKVLMDLFNATHGERWLKSEGWGSDRSVCDWHGVWCDFEAGDVNRPVVAALNLEENRLDGELPRSLGNLSHLHVLWVYGNRLSGRIPETLLERWDRNEFEFDGQGNSFSNLIVRATVEFVAVGTLCSVTDDARYRVEIDEPGGFVTFQGVRCKSAKSRETFCLVRQGRAPSLSRLSRALRQLGFTAFEPDYDYAFTAVTHGNYLTTSAEWGDGSKSSVRTYDAQGPIEVWSAQQLFLGLFADRWWDRESRKAKCDFQH